MCTQWSSWPSGSHMEPKQFNLLNIKFANSVYFYLAVDPDANKH